MAAQSDRAVVVGGGVIGCASAYYLAKAGWQVTIIERGKFGAGCSHGNCGLICPSHVLPLAEPGAVGRAIKALFQSQSPFYIRPRFSLALWNWLYHFAKRCNVADMMEAARACQALLESSATLYRELVAAEQLDCEWESRGALYVFRTQAEMDHYAETDRLLRESFGVAARRYDGDSLAQLEPALKPGLAGGWHYAGDAHLRPDRLLAEWRRVLEARGVLLREHCAVLGFEQSLGRATAVHTTGGVQAAESFVVAAGALTPELQPHLGCRIPIQPGKGYSITMPRPVRCPAIPLLFHEHRVVVTPLRSGYRLGSTMEFAGYDATINRHRLELLRSGARHYLHEPECDPVQEEWCGWRPMTYDSKPIIGPGPALPNVYVAAGHNMLGMSMAPATGKLIAELLTGDPPHIDPAPYALSRFR